MRAAAPLIALLLAATACGGPRIAPADGGRVSDGGPAGRDAGSRRDGARPDGPGPGPADGGGARPDAGADAAPPDDGTRPDAGRPADAAMPEQDPPGTWRSALYPRGWRPVHAGGAPDAEGRFLPDFSHAGWHRGETRPPYGAGAPVATVDAALGDGATDATSGIQGAIDRACAAGGGVVLLPAGTYRVRLPAADATAALRIGCSRLVLRGEGPARTRLLVDDPDRLRGKAAIAARGAGSIADSTSTTTYALVRDVTLPTLELELDGAPALAAGDWIAVRADNTDAFRAEHRMDEAASGEGGLWPASSFRGLVYPRRVVRVDGARLELDAPIHYPLRVRDRARVYALPGFLEEVGLESFAIGMVENRATPDRAEPGSDEDYGASGTTGYLVHASRAVELERVHDAWIHDVDSFRPDGNATGAHVLSIGFLLGQGASRVTVEACELGFPQYRGGGGNGYLFHLQGHDALLVGSTSEHARHGFIFNQAASGNVLRRVTAIDSRYSDDSHRFLANANLYDEVSLDRAWLQAVNRGTTSSGAGFTATRHVFWRTHVIANHRSARGCAVESAQWGFGYLVGSRAEAGAMALLCPRSFSNSYWAGLDQGAPEDLVEGEGMGETLWPPSLFVSQLALRCAREGRGCALDW